jgi:hypothetical protein
VQFEDCRHFYDLHQQCTVLLAEPTSRFDARGYGPNDNSTASYAFNLKASGMLPEPTWCVGNGQMGAECSTSGRFNGEISS